ncbi:uncharacterized protein SCHCODRAFT_02189182 [Schizophyllum commune H4-8]|uniref:uncharacterized protein n=1 Tax=Schizophyllum commune (strain H4-8 / FGSC 9210) TaxID=578458 RepID=UPI00215E2DF2|nr:uncharacterized protein SCHCODRAFT_02189182 [Schizophyllum commune H4-8]KAI5896362.1 hypothetical protein SCHCODRAFT_02189182 [Schizophyllum commune H4-8]
MLQRASAWRLRRLATLTVVKDSDDLTDAPRSLAVDTTHPSSLGNDSSGDLSTINASRGEGPPFEHSTYAQPVIRNGWFSASALRGSIRRYPGSQLDVCPKTSKSKAIQRSAKDVNGSQKLPSVSTGNGALAEPCIRSLSIMEAQLLGHAQHRYTIPRRRHESHGAAICIRGKA